VRSRSSDSGDRAGGLGQQPLGDLVALGLGDVLDQVYDHRQPAAAVAHRGGALEQPAFRAAGADHVAHQQRRGVGFAGQPPAARQLVQPDRRSLLVIDVKARHQRS
jgi:hypothetical protein